MPRPPLGCDWDVAWRSRYCHRAKSCRWDRETPSRRRCVRRSLECAHYGLPYRQRAVKAHCRRPVWDRRGAPALFQPVVRAALVLGTSGTSSRGARVRRRKSAPPSAAANPNPPSHHGLVLREGAAAMCASKRAAARCCLRGAGSSSWPIGGAVLRTRSLARARFLGGSPREDRRRTCGAS